MRTTISLPDPVLENAKLRASERGITLSELVSEAVQSYLYRNGDNPKPPPFKLITVPGKAFPGVDLDKTSELLYAEEDEFYRTKYGG